MNILAAFIFHFDRSADLLFGGTDKVAQNLQEARPTIMTVPRLYEAHMTVQRGVHQSGGFKERLFNLTLELGRKEKVEKQSLNF